MKKLFPILTLLLFFVPSFADHIVGGDIEYKLTGDKTWKIRLTLYRDCGGIPLCAGACGSACSMSMTARPASTATIAPFSNTGCTPASFNIPVTLNLVSVSDAEQQANALCPSSRKNACNNMGCTTPGSFSPSIEKYVFEGTLNMNNPTFPAGCSFWEIAWESCCRNPVISTIQNPAGAGFRIGAIININEGNTLADNRNNSPVLGNEPFIVICGGQEYYYNMGATDPDGDSLSYSLAPSLDQGGTPVSYVPPFTFNKPLPYNPLRPTTTSPNGGFTCDTFNGDINFVPIGGGTTPVVGIMTVQIKQWRRNAATGQPLLVGITQRDLQVWIISCPTNTIPRIVTSPVGPFNTAINKWNIAYGDSLCFDIIAKDVDSVSTAQYDSTRLFIDPIALNAMQGATFRPNYTGGRVNGPREDSYRFCWKPQASQARELPYFFSVISYDGKCPVPGRITRSFSITAYPPDSLRRIVKTFESCNKFTLSTSQIGLATNAQITWKISTKANQMNLDSNIEIRTGATVSSFPFNNGKGKYLVSAYLQYPDNTIKSILYDTVTADSAIIFLTGKLPDTVWACEGTGVSLGSDPVAGYSYLWNTGSKSSRINTTSAGLYVLTVTNANNCSTTSSVRVLRNPRPQLGARPAITDACAGSTIQIPAYPVVSNETGTWLYSFNPNAIDANNNTVNTSLFKLQPSNTGTAINWIVFSITSDSGCAAIDSVAIKTYGHPAISRISIKRTFCETDQPVTTASVFNLFPAGGTWSGEGILIDNNIPHFNPKGFASYPASSIVTYTYAYKYANTSLLCDVSDTVNTYVLNNPVIAPFSGRIDPFEHENAIYTIGNPSNIQPQWLFQGEAQVISTTNTEAEVVWGTAGPGKVKVILTTAQCTNTDSLIINIQQTVGVKEPTVFRNLQLFPNPVQSVINIVSPAQTNEPMTIRLFDVTGKTIIEKTTAAIDGKYDVALNVNHLSNGTYFINISIGSQQMQRKVNIMK